MNNKDGLGRNILMDLRLEYFIKGMLKGFGLNLIENVVRRCSKSVGKIEVFL